MKQRCPLCEGTGRLLNNGKAQSAPRNNCLSVVCHGCSGSGLIEIGPLIKPVPNYVVPLSPIHKYPLPYRTTLGGTVVKDRYWNQLSEEVEP